MENKSNSIFFSVGQLIHHIVIKQILNVCKICDDNKNTQKEIETT